MEITEKPHMLSLPLPLYATVSLGSAVNRDGEHFSLIAGLDEKLVEQLKKYSLDESDEEIQKNTSDRQRFGEGSYEKWYAKNRTPFALVHEKTGALAALVWFGPKQLGRKSLKHLSSEELEKEYSQKEGEWHTIVYRAYPPFRGTGIMKAFALFCIEAYSTAFPGIRLWAGINDVSNEASIGFARKLGFEDFSSPEETLATGQKIMVRG